MKLLGGLAVLAFALALGLFLTAGLRAYAEGEEAASALAVRVAELERARREVPVVSYGELEQLLGQRDELGESVGQRLTILLGGELPAPPADLARHLEGTELAAFARGSPLREAVLAWAGGRPHAALAVAALAERLRDAGIEQVEELTAPADGEVLPVPGVPGLGAIELELVVVSEMPELLALLEGLVPGRGAPALTVRGASLRRIEPAFWSAAPERLTSPPARLRVSVSVLFAVASDVGDA